MNGGLGYDDVDPAIEFRFRKPIEQLKRIGEPHADRAAAQLAQEAIIMAPAPAQPLAGSAKANAGNTNQGFREMRRGENFRIRRRLQNSVRPRRKLRGTRNAPRRDAAAGWIDSGEEYRAPGAERVG